ncbi:WD repeat-containing protein 3-like isoform X1 [Mytilus trossulus]|uniref:WD repeat-containing protein 3-like isoform X1 n=1 Tax=Mytilus trossulus TaxID=6551 RepID=UPI003007364F
MGVTKQYLRYIPGPSFGVIGSSKANILFLDVRGVRGKYCAVGACEDVIVWDLRTGEKFNTLKGEKHEVTALAKSPDKKHIAVGYNDGMVKVFDVASGDLVVNFSGHKSTVTTLSYDHQGMRLVSGGKDTDVIVWDIVNEAGLFRLKGHKGQITQLSFLKQKDVLITSSKDTFVKFWDLETQHCFKTLVGHRSEVYGFVVVRNGQRLITGSADSELRVWDIDYLDTEQDEEPEAKRPRVETMSDEEEEEEEMNILKCKKIGSVMRKGRHRVVSMATDETGSVLACHGTDHVLEVFSLPSTEELRKHLAKRQKRLNKKLKDEDEEVKADLKLEDEISHANNVKLSAKLSSFDIILEGPAQTKVLALLNNNTIESCCVNQRDKNGEITNSQKLMMAGHRTDVRTICTSSDNTAILSGSGETVKIWNRSTLQCIRTMECDYALCSLFAPGDRIVIVGTKGGKLQLFDVASGVLLDTIDSHTTAVWGICMAPDKRGVVTGSADKTVKFWNFEMVSDETYSESSKRLSLEHVKTLQMDEDVLGVKYSPDQRYIAVALLDNTVKVFFTDTLKFFLSMYGHKLPVLCLDISSDSSLLITGSADRNVKIWGMDFGDCHKSIFAHDDSIMCLQFVAKTHLFFTGGKDGKIKQWDADNFEHITTLTAHHAEIWSLTVSSAGHFMVSGSHDKSLRLWERSKEPLVLEEEREMEREAEYEDSVAQSGEPVVAGETNTEVGLAGKKSIETVKGAEKIMEALELYKEETLKLEQHAEECKEKGKELPPPTPHPMLLAHNVSSPARFMLVMLKKVRSSELEESLLVLPFSYVIDMLKVLEVFIDSGWEIELSCRCLFFLLRVHHGQITSNQVLLPVIDRLRTKTVDQVNKLRDQIGFNIAGLQFMKGHIEESQEVQFFMDASGQYNKKKKKEKKKAILSIKT